MVAGGWGLCAQRAILGVPGYPIVVGEGLLVVCLGLPCRDPSQV